MIISLEEYKEKICEMIKNLKRDRWVPYFIGHFPRFVWTVETFEKYVNLNDESIVFDCGSDIPFSTYYLHLKYNCEIVCGDIGWGPPWKLNNKVHRFDFNICFDEFKENFYDVVVLTEVLEHLPCNLYKVKEKVINSIKKGGWLLVSYPLGTPYPIIKASYEHDFVDMDWKQISHGHLREWTPKKAREFINEMDIIAENTVYTREYGGFIYHILYRKKEKEK